MRDRRPLRERRGSPPDSIDCRGGRDSVTGEPKLRGVYETVLYAQDLPAAARFYRDVLGLPHLYTFGNLAFFDCGGIRLFLEQGSQPSSQSVIYFRVSDIHGAHAALSARGAVFVSAPHMIHRHADGTEEWMAFFEDNESRPLAIMAQVKP